MKKFTSFIKNKAAALAEKKSSSFIMLAGLCFMMVAGLYLYMMFAGMASAPSFAYSEF